ncbi:MAG: tetratricopeptide repeat protein [Candidatus Caldatribacteriota bacterium]|nr:tetratricopeptide repeat protein [Candidatus Caldatribacteriota bacterium]
MKKVCIKNAISTIIFFLVLLLLGSSIICAQDDHNYYKTGYEYFVQENYQMAEEYYKKAIEINPDFENAHYWLGKVYRKIGNYGKAVKEWKEVLRINPQNQYAFWNFVNSFKSTSLVQSDNASDYLNQGIKMIGDPQEYLFKEDTPSVDVLLSSIPYFEKSENIEPNLTEANYWAGEVYRILGNKVTSQFLYLAIENYEKAINTEEVRNPISFIHPSTYWHSYTQLSQLYSFLRLKEKKEKLWLNFETIRALPYQKALEREGYYDFGYPPRIEVSFEEGDKIENWSYPEKDITFIVINGEVQGEKEKEEQIEEIIIEQTDIETETEEDLSEKKID